MSVKEILFDRKFIRLLRIRWTGQLTDGIFQSALASFVLFSPERQADAMSAALAFALVLVPYSIVGPFVGTILDRFSRQRALFFANMTRAITLSIIALLIFQGRTGIEITVFVLIAFGVNRLILAGLSAGLPLVISRHHLISANALAVTGGSVWVVLGGGIGLGIRQLLDGSSSADSADAIIILVGSLGYLVAAFFASLLAKDEIGPRRHEIVKGSFTQGLIEMREGFQFLRNHADAARGIAAIAIHRGGLTALTLAALLLERNTFNDPADSEAGLAGLSLTLTIAAVGFVAVPAFVSAALTPRAVKLVSTDLMSPLPEAMVMVTSPEVPSACNATAVGALFPPCCGGCCPPAGAAVVVTFTNFAAPSTEKYKPSEPATAITPVSQSTLRSLYVPVVVPVAACAGAVVTAVIL